jgi:hypothetical protein
MHRCPLLTRVFVGLAAPEAPQPSTRIPGRLAIDPTPH